MLNFDGELSVYTIATAGQAHQGLTMEQRESSLVRILHGLVRRTCPVSLLLDPIVLSSKISTLHKI